jgi:hypothetical protein
MSNYLAIATVTAALQDVLQEAAAVAVPGATVTVQRPEAASNGAQSDPKINLYLYQVAPNAGWRNSELSFRYASATDSSNRGKDRVEQRAIVPLNLHYLISFYGAESELQPQRLLGGAVGALQAQARVSLSRVRSAVQSRSYLTGSDLDFQLEHIEHVQLSPILLDLEEMSKIWSVFFQVPHALSIAYEAAVVLIEPGAPRSTPVVTDPRAALKQLRGVYLFSIEEEFWRELDQGVASTALRAAFQAHTYMLSAEATVRVVTMEHQWQIDDPARRTVFEQVQRYRVERGEGALDIYDASAEARERKQ